MHTHTHAGTHTRSHTSIHQLVTCPHLHLRSLILLPSNHLQVIRSCCLFSRSRLSFSILFCSFLFLSLLFQTSKISCALIPIQAFWTFHWAPWASVSCSCAPSIALSVLCLQKNGSCNPEIIISLPYDHFFSNWDISCPAILFGLLWRAMWLNGFPFEGNERPDRRYESSEQHVAFQFHALTFQVSSAVSFSCPLTEMWWKTTFHIFFLWLCVLLIVL